MRRLSGSLLGTVILVALCAGCSSDPKMRALIAEALPGKPDTPEPNAQFSAAYQADAPAVAAAVESKPEAIAVLLRQSVSDVSGVETMIAADGSQLMFDRGLLVGSRGFGYDVLASEVSQSAALVHRLATGEATRLMTLIDGNDNAVTRSFRCRIAPGATETVVVGQTPVSTRTVTEECRGPLAQFYNFYWVVPGSGEIVQSSQWAGPLTGKISLRKAILTRE